MNMVLARDPLEIALERDPSPQEVKRADEIYHQHEAERHKRADRMFAILMFVQWYFAIVLAFMVSPYAWTGKVREFHPHLYAAIFLGGAITLFPVLLSLTRPGWVVTRHVNVVAQMLWSALLIHLTGGRIETHFHVFGSLAFVAFYFSWRVLGTATLVVSADHFLRGLLYPESVYGIVNPEWWRFLEHAGWVVFEDAVLVFFCLEGLRAMREAALRQARLETLTANERLKNEELYLEIREINLAAAK